MARKKIVSPFAHLYHRESFYTMPDGRVVERGEIIKIQGVYATKFKFFEHVRRIDSDIDWIDCFELEKGIQCGQRSFRTDRIKVLPKARRKRRKKNLSDIIPK
jgi:hypothetical protein